MIQQPERFQGVLGFNSVRCHPSCVQIACAQNINFSFAAVDKNDKAIKNLLANVQLVRYEWQTVLKKDYSDQFYYASEKKEIIEWNREINLNNSPQDFSFIVTRSGEYELRLSKKGDDFYQSKKF